MMKPVLSALALVALSSAPAVAEDETSGDGVEMTKGEKKLAKMLDGRVAGEPERCIRDRPVRSFKVIDDTAIVYKIGRTVWVNYTRNPETLDDRDTLVFRRFGSQLCSTDIVTTIDPVGGFYTGNVFLTEFIPYRMPKAEDS